jgi:hypothetical protein
MLKQILARYPEEKEFHQAVREFVETITPVLERHPEYQQLGVLDRILEPERVIIFRVPWMDDEGWVRVNRAYRVKMNSAIGPIALSPAQWKMKSGRKMPTTCSTMVLNWAVGKSYDVNQVPFPRRLSCYRNPGSIFFCLVYNTFPKFEDDAD